MTGISTPAATPHRRGRHYRRRPRIIAGILPAVREKAKEIAAYSIIRQPVAVVGDGSDDAPP